MYYNSKFAVNMIDIYSVSEYTSQDKNRSKVSFVWCLCTLRFDTLRSNEISAQDKTSQNVLNTKKKISFSRHDISFGLTII